MNLFKYALLSSLFVGSFAGARTQAIEDTRAEIVTVIQMMKSPDGSRREAGREIMRQAVERLENFIEDKNSDWDGVRGEVVMAEVQDVIEFGGRYSPRSIAILRSVRDSIQQIVYSKRTGDDDARDAAQENIEYVSVQLEELAKHTNARIAGGAARSLLIVRSYDRRFIK